VDSPDCSIVETAQGSYLISTTDFFYPLVTDPFLQGQIACCNVLSDLYALGVTRCDNLLMILAASLKMPEPDRGIVTREMMKGFNEVAARAGTSVTGGQSVLNPWPIIGGVAMTNCSSGEFIRPCGALPGDKLVLTKPIGTQIAVNLYEWMTTKPHLFERLQPVMTKAEVLKIYSSACKSMGTLNRTAAALMHECSAHAATDVTGFGLLGHALNLAKAQHAEVKFTITVLPCIAGTPGVDTQVFDFKLVQGYSAETSGGLLIALPAASADVYLARLKEETGTTGWIVGEVTEGERTAEIAGSFEVLEVDW
jgi:selenide,water dikinase